MTFCIAMRRILPVAIRPKSNMSLKGLDIFTGSRQGQTNMVDHARVGRSHKHFRS